MNPTPVAWQWFNTMNIRKSVTEYSDPQEWNPLFTEAQLNQARADALREAAEWFNKDAGIVQGSGKVTVAAFQLNKLADEIEGEKKWKC